MLRKLYQCGTCPRLEASEAEIRAHQDRFANLHAVDPEIDEHDGQPWRIRELVVGEEFVHGRDRVLVTRVETDGGERWAIIPQASGDLSLVIPVGLLAHINGSREADEQQVRVFAAAIDACGIDPDHEEISMSHHLWQRYKHWHRREPGRFHLEAAWINATMAALAVCAARRSKDPRNNPDAPNSRDLTPSELDAAFAPAFAAAAEAIHGAVSWLIELGADSTPNNARSIELLAAHTLPEYALEHGGSIGSPTVEAREPAASSDPRGKLRWWIADGGSFVEADDEAAARLAAEDALTDAYGSGNEWPEHVERISWGYAVTVGEAEEVEPDEDGHSDWAIREHREPATSRGIDVQGSTDPRPRASADLEARVTAAIDQSRPPRRKVAELRDRAQGFDAAVARANSATYKLATLTEAVEAALEHMDREAEFTFRRDPARLYQDGVRDSAKQLRKVLAGKTGKADAHPRSAKDIDRWGEYWMFDGAPVKVRVTSVCGLEVLGFGSINWQRVLSHSPGTWGGPCHGNNSRERRLASA